MIKKFIVLFVILLLILGLSIIYRGISPLFGVEEINKDAEINISYFNITPNTKIEWNLGQKFKYQEIFNNYNRTDIFIYHIINTEEIDRKKYFVIEQENFFEKKIYFIGISIDLGEVHQNKTYYFDGEKIYEKNSDKLEESNILLFDYWMLGLEDGKTFEMKRTITTSSDGGVFTYTNKYKVVGREYIGSTECFKVISDEDTYWIDAQKRILVKEEEANNVNITLTA